MNTPFSVSKQNQHPSDDKSPVSRGKTESHVRQKRILLVGGIGALTTLGCLVACVGAFASGMFAVATQKDDVEAILSEYMQAMTTKDIDRAYSLFSQRAKAQTPLAELGEWTVGSNFAMFDGYQNLDVRSLTIGPLYDDDPKSPRGTVARASGIVEYRQGYEGTFQAVLEKNSGEWKIHSLHITLPCNNCNGTSS